ncbi:hypothetical protein [Achromobacter phage Motura]|uniref:Lipoprotein n=1 Tax=Achromobacter phage Motura TaxID=2591403 RepID=A0A514CT76_9CAUD|nr:hypothetical protein H1O15_gp274 [Achromobacter phage Motura]QDH83687.1 hypothetical protein [Achromobacter phage Motura]
MKRSAKITLVLLGTMALTACGDGNESRQTTRQQYKSMADCQREWGTDSRNCTTSSSGHFFGPLYFWNHSTGTPMVVGAGGETRAVPNAYANPANSAVARSSAISTSTSTAIVRGGFGSTGSSFSAGG